MLNRGTWSATQTGTIDDYDTEYGEQTSVYEMRITAVVDRDYVNPTLNLTVSHPSPTDLTIELVAADGTVHTVKNTGDPIPSAYSITGLSSTWLTGGYKLMITDYTEGGEGTLTAWGISL